MITRRASEIIRLALTMSQIQNADALSWRDKIDMLNQSYIRLYDDLNNNGDLYYVKEIDFTEPPRPGPELHIKLPKDFWKLLLVGYRSSRGEIVPLERAPNTGQFFSGYRIINNEIVFSNYFTPGPLVIRYLPPPQTITYPRIGYRLMSNAIQAAYDSINDTMVFGDVGLITVINNSIGKTASLPVQENDENSPFVIAVSAGVLYVVKGDAITCYDYNLQIISELAGTFDLYAHAIGWEEGIIVTQSGEPMKYVSGGAPEPSLNYWNFMDGMINRIDSNQFNYVRGDETQDISTLFENADSFVIADPYIYINKGGDVKVYDRFVTTDLAPALVGRGSRKGIVLAAEANNETGFGVIFRDFYSGLNLLGFAADTVLNYPQNIFFDWLTTDLAVKFRVALDIPTGELPALSEDYHDTLMKGLSRDAYQSARINNRYGTAYL